MKQIKDRVGGLDVHKNSVVACTRVRAPTGEIEIDKATFATTQRGLAELTSFLVDADVTTVAMEATGIYWRPVYYALEGVFEDLWLCNAQHVKNVPGRKTDLSDAEWLADVCAHGMVRPSFVPPPEIRGMRELTRYRKTQIDTRAKEIQRVEKVFQDAGMKLTSVASKVWSVSSREMIEAIIAGERDATVLAGMAKGKLRDKRDRLEEALESNVTEFHVAMLETLCAHIDHLDKAIASTSEKIAAALLPFEAKITLVTSIPGVAQATAQVIIAETGGDMGKFPTPGHLSAWAGVAPASYESAGKRRPAGTRKGNPHLQRALVEAAKAASRTKGTHLAAQYSRLAGRRGPNKATVAVAHSILVIVWHLLTTGALYDDPGGDYFDRRIDPSRQAKRLRERIEALGFDVTVSERAVA